MYLNCLPWLENSLKHAGPKLSPMVGQNFEICWPEMAINVLKLSTMVGQNFEICWPQIAINVLKLSTIQNCNKGGPLQIFQLSPN